MKIAELFVALGVKGDGQANRAVKDVDKGLKGVYSSGLAAKAAIAGVVYGLERMMSNSAHFGTTMLNFATQTGLSAQNLQKLQYAARLAGVESDELEGSIRGVQQSMTNMLLGKGAPEGLAMLANKVGFDPKRARDTYYVFEQLQKLAQKLPPDMATAMIKSFGVSENTIAAMMRGSFNPKVLSSAPTYSDNELQSLNKVDVAWSRLGKQVEMAFGHFTSKHGLEIVQNISMISKEVFKLADALVKVSEKYKIFELMGEVVNGLSMAMRLLSGESVDKIMKGEKGKRHFGDGTWWMNAIEKGEDMLLGAKDAVQMKHAETWQAQKSSEMLKANKSGGGDIHQNITHIGDAKDTRAVKDLHGRAARDANNAHKQSPAQAGGI